MEDQREIRKYRSIHLVLCRAHATHRLLSSSPKVDQESLFSSHDRLASLVIAIRSDDHKFDTLKSFRGAIKRTIDDSFT